MIENLKLSDFEQHLNTKFLFKWGEGNTIDLEMETAADLGSTPGQEQFSIIFRGPADPMLIQGIYRLEHEKMGALDLFLVPISRDEGGVRYEAVFNRVVR